MKRILLPLLVSALLAGPVLAGEGYKEKSTGVTVMLDGYGLGNTEIYEMPRFQVDINRRVWIKGGTPKWITLPGNNPEIRTLVRNLTVSLGFWEYIPTCRLRFRLGYFRTITGTFVKDSYNVVSLAGGAYQYGGQASGHLDDSGGLPESTEFDAKINRSTNSGDASGAQATTVHEIGHGIGFTHSWLHRNSVLRLTGSRSPHSIMSYSTGNEGIINGGVLNADDVALASRTYPNQFHRLSRTTGTVLGVARTADGRLDIYGANVILIERSTGQAFLHRISGYASSPPNGVLNGRFSLTGVPPGTYDLVIAPMDDPSITLGFIEPSISYMLLMANGTTDWPRATLNFAAGFERGWVRNIEVVPGRIVDVGDALAGEDREVSRPSRLDVEVSHPDTGCSRYWFDFWSNRSGEMAHRSGARNANHYQANLPSDWYAVRIFGWTGSNWILLQNWRWQDFTGRHLSIRWPNQLRQVRIPVSFMGFTFTITLLAAPVDYHFRLRTRSGNLVSASPVHGNELVTHVAPGTYRFQALAQWNLNELPFPIRRMDPLVVNE